MKVQSSISSHLTAAGSHKQTLIFSGRRTRRHDISGWTRARLRSGVGVAFDTASTMLDRSLNNDARRRSGVSTKLRPQRQTHTKRPTDFLNSMPLPFANALSDCLRIFSGTHSDRCSVMSPSRSGGWRSRTARERGALSVLREERARRPKKVPAGTPYFYHD